MGNSLALQSLCCEALADGPACRILHRLSRPALWRHRFPHVDCAMSCGDSKRGCVAPNVRLGSKQTFAVQQPMSVLGQKRTCGVQKVMPATPESGHGHSDDQARLSLSPKEKPWPSMPPAKLKCSAFQRAGRFLPGVDAALNMKSGNKACVLCGLDRHG